MKKSVMPNGNLVFRDVSNVSNPLQVYALVRLLHTDDSL